MANPHRNRAAGFSLDVIWQSLLDGDPGPTLALLDAFIENDMPYAAGGLLRDLAERISDAETILDDEQQRALFVTVTKQVLQHALQNDETAIAELFDDE